MEAIKRALADSGFRHGAVAGFSLGASVFCGIIVVLFIIGVITA